MIIWITGPSGVGKTTLARKFFSAMRTVEKNTIYLDGDSLRYINSDDLSHSVEDRYKNARRMQKLCNYLDKQGFHVIVSMLLLFDDICLENYETFSSFHHFNLQASSKTLISRDRKEIYTSLDPVLLQMSQLMADTKKVILNGGHDVLENVYQIMRFTGVRLKYNYSENPKTNNEWWHKYNDYDYLGSEFIDSYFFSRNQVLLNLQDVATKTQTEKFILQYLFDKGSSREESVFLESHFYRLLLGQLQDSEKIEITLKLIKKFESSKKFYKYYDSNLNRTQDELAENESYLIFSYLVSSFIDSELLQTTQKVIFLNALLKVNDLIIGKFWGIMEVQWKKVLSLSIKREIKFVSGLLN
jgi:adenylylsulfate kinase